MTDPRIQINGRNYAISPSPVTYRSADSLQGFPCQLWAETLMSPCLSQEGKGWLNPMEAELAVELAAFLVGHSYPVAFITILTTYRRQLRMLTQLVGPLDECVRQRAASTFGPPSKAYLPRKRIGKTSLLAGLNVDAHL